MTDVATYDPFHESLWGEVTRGLLVGTAACSCAAWAIRVGIEPIALVMSMTNLLVLTIALSRRFAGLPRLLTTSFFGVGLLAMFLAMPTPNLWWTPPVMFSPGVTAGALLVLACRDGLIAIRKSPEPISRTKLVVVAAILGVAAYMIVIPGVDAVLETFRERPEGYAVEALSPLEVLRIRSAKLAVFAIFAYAGACVGSFLNVVAASAPRGEPIALRSSACPHCGTPIRRLDNLPIVSYLRLRGRCRDCGASIPLRYLYVEGCGFAIFSSLFLYELITGAANVPGFQHYHYAGILWIILYTKWPVVGIYFFHGMLFSCVLMLSLMEQDRLRPPRWMLIGLPVLFAGLVIVFPTMLTVSLGDQTPLRWPAAFPAWLDRLATCIAGGLVGGAVGSLAKSLRLRRRQATSSLVPAFVLIGIALGWQAVLTIALFWLLFMKVVTWAGGRRFRPNWLTATTLLFAIAMLHHPAWKWLAHQLSVGR